MRLQIHSIKQTLEEIMSYYEHYSLYRLIGIMIHMLPVGTINMADYQP